MPEELVVGVERPEFEFASCGERRELMSIIESVFIEDSDGPLQGRAQRVGSKVLT